MSVIRMLVVGAGPMGRLHARTLAAHESEDPELCFVASVDRNLDRAEEVAARYGVVATSDPLAIVPTVDAAIVAVPTASHVRVAARLIEAGVDVLVEKPLASNLEEAERLVALAQEYGRVLQVGHVEWYNPAWRAAVARAGVPRAIEVERCRPYGGRGLDIDVVRDLMLHDLDWVQRLVGEEPGRVEATGRRVESDSIDEAHVTLDFASGCVARIHASRVDSKERRIATIEGDRGSARADLLHRRLVDPGEAADVPGAEGRGGAAPTLEAEGADPLRSQLRDFLAAVRSRETPENDGRVGIGALRSVDRVLAAIEADDIGSGQ